MFFFQSGRSDPEFIPNFTECKNHSMSALPFYYYSCDSRNIIETSRCLLFSSKILRMILNNSDILFGSDCKLPAAIHLVRWNERVVIMHSYADVIEMKRANVRNYAFVLRVMEMKRMSVKYSFAESFACIQMRMRNFVFA